MEPTINISGDVILNLGRTEKKVVSSIPLTPFLKNTYLDVDKRLLWFNTYVDKIVKQLGGPDSLNSELFDMIHVRAEKLRGMSDSDYNTELVTLFAAEICAAAFQLFINFGGEPVILKRG